VFRIDPCRHDEAWVIDPVCGMRLREVDALSPLGRVGFCSTRCQALFRAQPEHEDGAPAES
jgi:YHS domain-containing protein